MEHKVSELLLSGSAGLQYFEEDDDRKLRGALPCAHTAQQLVFRPRTAEPSNSSPHQQSEDDRTEYESRARQVLSPDSHAVVTAGDPFSALPVDLPRHIVTEQVNDCKGCDQRYLAMC